MKGFQIAAIVAAIATAPRASNLLGTAATGPAATTAALVRMRLGVRRWPRQAKRLVDIWVAAMLARRERQAAAWASHRLHGRAPGGASLREARTGPGRLR